MATIMYAMRIEGITVINVRKTTLSDRRDFAGRPFQKIKTGISIFLINAAILVVILLGCELAVRLWRPQLTYSLLLTHIGDRYAAGDFIPFTLKRNYEAKAISQEVRNRFVTYTTNRHGLRGKDVSLSKPKGTSRILVLGDSYTFGVYVDDEETYPAVLEQLLHQKSQKVEVLNAGYTDGWSPDEHYAWLINHGLAFDPDLIVYGFFVGNDVEEIHSEDWIERDERGLPTRIVNNSIWVDDLGRIRSKVKDSKTVGTAFVYSIPILRESHLLVLLNHKINALSDQLFHVDAPAIQTEWCCKNPFPMILREKTDNSSTAENEQIFLQIVRGMADIARQHGSQFLVLMIPINFQVESSFLDTGKVVLGPGEHKVRRNFFDELKPFLDASKIEYVDLLQAMKATPGSYFPKNGEVHFSPGGHRFAALTLNRYLENSQPPKKLFSEEQTAGQ
jgi:hypothetical protein